MTHRHPSVRPTRSWAHRFGAIAATVAVLAASTVGAVTASSPPTSTPPAATSTTAGTGDNPSGCIEDTGDRADVFADRFEVQYAENYTLSYESNYKVLTVGATSLGGGDHSYVLVQCGTEAPVLEGELAGAAIIEVPVTTLFSESTSHDGFIDVLDLEGALTGVADGSWIVTPSIRARIDAGEISSFNTAGVIDTEMVVAADPDVYITGGFDDPAHETISGAGIPVVVNAEWLETTPKGWAEWIGVFAALTNTERRASELFAEWIAGYDEAAALVANVEARPTVLTGGLFEGTWYATGGAGIAAEFIADAGGDYLYADNDDTGSIELDIETVVTEGADADVWLLAAGFATYEEAESADSRNLLFDAWERGGVFTQAVTPDPSVNPFEQGPVMIDHYLRDYIAILHPELVPDHELVFFTEVTPS